jgi:hypothetical protein
MPRVSRTFTLFWITGKDRRGIEFHHRDALAAIETCCTNGCRQAAEQLQSDRDHSLDEAARDQLSLVLLEQGDRHEAAALKLATTRQHVAFSVAHLENFLGFQLTADGRPRNERVLRLDVDSSLSSAVKRAAFTRHLASLDKTELRRISRRYSLALGRLHEAIDPDIRAYREIGFAGLGQLKAQGVSVVAPAGLRLVEIKSSR